MFGFDIKKEKDPYWAKWDQGENWPEGFFWAWKYAGCEHISVIKYLYPPYHRNNLHQTQKEKKDSPSFKTVGAWYKSATHESIVLKLLITLSVTLFIASFIWSTFIKPVLLHVVAIGKNDPFPSLKKTEGRERQLARQLDYTFLSDQEECGTLGAVNTWD